MREYWQMGEFLILIVCVMSKSFEAEGINVFF